MRNIAFSFTVLLFTLMPSVAAREEPVITGIILQSPGQPMAKVRVELVPVLSLYESGRIRIETGRSPEPAAIVQTGEDGRFRLPAAGKAVWKVVVRAPGRVPVQFGPVLWVEMEATLPAVVLPRDVGTTVKVFDEQGRPVPDAWVFATDAEEIEEARRQGIWKIEPRAVRTAADGTAILPRLAGRPLDLRILAPGRTSETRKGFTGDMVQLSKPAADSRAVLRVETPEGQPVAGVQVRFGEVNWPLGVTDAQGSLPIPVSPMDAPRLRLLAADGRQKVARLSPGAGPVLKAIVDEHRTLAGRVLDEATGRGLGGALLSPEIDPGAVVRTDEEGRYRLTLPEPRRLAVQIWAPGYLSKRLALSAADVQGGRLPSVSLERAVLVTGLVLNEKRQPLAGVEIEAVPAALLGPRLLSPRQPVADRAETSGTGGFTLRRLQTTESYEIRARRTGYLQTALPLSVPKGGLSRKPIQFRLNPDRPAQGRVTDTQGEPLAGAVIVVRPAARLGFQVPDPRSEPVPKEDDPSRTHSDSQGRFQLATCPAEEMDLEVIRPGFATAWRRGIRVAGGKGPVELGTIVLAPGVHLAGRVLDIQSRPIADAQIFLLSTTTKGLQVEDFLEGRKPDTSSDPQGRFEIADLAKGAPHHLVAKAEGYLPAMLSAVRAPANKPLVVRLQRAASLRGRVVDEEGSAVADAQVDLTWQDVLPETPERRVGKPVIRQALTDAEGRFELRGSPEGVVTLDVTARGFAVLEGVEVTVPWRDPSQELQLVLTRGALLSGRVTTTAGESVARAKVSSTSGSGWSDAEGFYRFDGVSTGAQEIQAVHPDYPRLRMQVVIEPGENDLDFIFEAGTEVAGRIVDEAGRPVAAAQVALMSMIRRERMQYRAVSDENGRFSLRPVTAGEYRLEAEADDFGRGELRNPVRVMKEPVTGLEVVLRPNVVLSGNVLGLTPEELATVRIEARKTEGKSLPALLDAEGHYEVRGLDPGDWLVRATIWQGQRHTQIRVPVGPEDQKLNRDLEFSRRASLTGRIFFNDDPLPEALLSVRGRRLTHERAVTTDYEGAFLLADLEPDVYRLGVSHPGKSVIHNQWVEVTGDQDLEIRLQDSTLAGRVAESGSGKPVPEAVVALRPTLGPEFMLAAGTQEDGSFRLMRVPPDSYRLTVTANGYEPLEQEVQVATGENMEGLEISLHRAQGIRLQVRQASGKIPGMVHLLALASDGRPVVAETRRPDAEGWVDLSTLPAGQWSLVIAGPGAAATTRSLVVPGDPILVTLPDAASFQVRVVPLATTDLAATLTLTSTSQQPFWTLAPGGQIQQSWPLVGGQGRVEGVPAGIWLIKVQASDGRIWTGTLTSSGSGDQAISLE